MDGSVHRYKAKIGGRTYTIVGKRDTKHMDAVIELMNNQLSVIKDASDEMDNEQAAILVAINALSKQVDMQKRLQEIEQTLDGLQQSVLRFNELDESTSD